MRYDKSMTYLEQLVVFCGIFIAVVMSVVAFYSILVWTEYRQVKQSLMQNLEKYKPWRKSRSKNK